MISIEYYSLIQGWGAVVICISDRRISLFPCMLEIALDLKRSEFLHLPLNITAKLFSTIWPYHKFGCLYLNWRIETIIVWWYGITVSQRNQALDSLMKSQLLPFIPIQLDTLEVSTISCQIASPQFVSTVNPKMSYTFFQQRRLR